jgi:WD40 repeat protein
MLPCSDFLQSCLMNDFTWNTFPALIAIAKVSCTEIQSISASSRSECLFSPDSCAHPSMSNRTEFIITTSIDGHLKLWKKQDTGIEFVKHYRAHIAPITGISASADGQLCASISEDGNAKVFDVVNFGELRRSSVYLSRIHTYLLPRHDQHD